MGESTPNVAANNEAAAALQRAISEAQPSAGDELLALAGELLAENNALRAELNAALSLADRDPLCPVLNRRAFARELDREIARAERHKGNLALLFIDLDNFKQINDAHGHAAGDETLVAMATELANAVRKSDLVARLGGDEFAVLLVGTDADRAKSCAKTVEKRLKSVLPAGTAASIGLASWSVKMSAGDLIEIADKAMYAAKTARKSGQSSP